ncbi:MerR family transcriptional regulator [Histidinibacterium lentulum]|nr:MerR family transcriptional regulator [Histidinibacterium lentulum]
MSARETIADVAHRFCLTHRTLRFWEAKGLLTPYRREARGRRTYTAEDCQRIAAIVDGQKLGLTLEEIRDALTADNALQLSEERLGELKAAAVAAAEECAARLRRIDEVGTAGSRTVRVMPETPAQVAANTARPARAPLRMVR